MFKLLGGLILCYVLYSLVTGEVSARAGLAREPVRRGGPAPTLARSALHGLLTACALSVSMAAMASTAAPRLRILAVDPARAMTLDSGDRVSVYFRYRSSGLVRFHAQLYSRGVAIKPSRSGRDRLYPEGNLVSFCWLTVDEPAAADELRVTMVDGTSEAPLAVVDVPVQIQFTGRSGSARTPAAWVAQKRMAAGFNADQADEEAQMDRILPPWTDQILFWGFMLVVWCVLAVGAVAPVYALAKWQGGWRTVPALLVVVLGLKLLSVVVELHADPTSHNLLPFETGMWFGAAALLMLIVWLCRRVALSGSK